MSADTFALTVFAPYQRAEQALDSALVECHLQRASTRKVRHVVGKRSAAGVSACKVSRVGKPLGSQLAAWRTRKVVPRFAVPITLQIRGVHRVH